MGKNNTGQSNGMIRKRDKVHEPPPSANCQKTFQQFNYIPETPKGLDINGNSQSFDIPGGDMDFSKQLDEFNKLSLDSENTIKLPANTTVPTELSRTTKLPTETYPSVQLYTKICQHPNLLPVIKHDCKTDGVHVLYEYLSPSPASLVDRLTLPLPTTTTQTTNITYGISESAIQQCTLALLNLLSYVHQRDIIIKNFNISQLSFLTQSSAFNAIRLSAFDSLLALDKRTTSPAAIEKYKKQNLSDLYHIYTEITYKDHTKFSRMLTEVTNRFKNFFGKCAETTTPSCSIKIKHLLDHEYFKVQLSTESEQLIPRNSNLAAPAHTTTPSTSSKHQPLAANNSSPARNSVAGTSSPTVQKKKLSSQSFNLGNVGMSNLAKRRATAKPEPHEFG